MLNQIYEAMMADSYISGQASGRIKFYEYPETGSVTAPYVVIDPLAPASASDFADNTWLTDEYLYQIDVWTKDREITDKLSKRIRKVLWEIGLYEKRGQGVDEWDEDTGIFRIARRYEGKAYNENIEE
ncbi:hypothetical protein [Halobacillus sp. BBL2006]|uniref:hypothetical protein n=1 Tax=Halobacillus sp. BBL2006 TaxID=1543706 RepID=UPI0005425A57|nr:hypothetical protein [Halobacillus sp. BBL2006]KHE73155.1 hypothetical protein LD39_00765 [Halobacillus sp. BBL2006]